MKSFYLSLVTALTLATASQSHAAPLVLGDQVNVGNTSGSVFTPTPVSADSDGLFTNVRFSLNGGTSQSASAGLFVLDYQHVPAAVGTSWQQFLSFCLEPDVSLYASSYVFDNPYTVKSMAGAGYSAVSDAISELWGRYFSGITSNTTAAAFQVALWELAYGTSDKNLSTGDFKLSDPNSGVGTQAQSWLKSLNGMGPKAEGLVVLVDKENSYERQDLITQGHVVPEPGLLALLGVGLAGVAVTRRRTRAHGAG